MKKAKKATTRPKPKGTGSAKSPESEELSDAQLEGVAGGRKAGGEQVQYLEIKLTDTKISGF